MPIDPFVENVIRPHILEAANEISDDPEIRKTAARKIVARHFEGLPDGLSELGSKEEVFETVIAEARKLLVKKNGHKPP